MKNNGHQVIVYRLIVLLVAFSPVSPLAEEFRIVVLPDTQKYSQNNPAIFEAQTRWISYNADALKIRYVAHLGDIVQCPNNVWTNADTAMDILDSANIRYGVLPGNHDYDGAPTPDPTDPRCGIATVNYNTTFGSSRFNNLVPPSLDPAEYGNYDGTNNNNYILFDSPGGLEFIAINLAFSNTVDVDVLDWMDLILKANADRWAIITSHYIVAENNTGGVCESDDTGPYGEEIMDRLAKHPNAFLLLSGHCLGEKWITYSHDGPVPTDGSEFPVRNCLGDVNGLLSNYQRYDNTGMPANHVINASGNDDSGYMRVIHINTDTNTNNVTVNTFSPWIDGVPDPDGAGPDPAVAAHPTTASPPPTTGVTTAAGMGLDTVSNFSFSHDFDIDKIKSPSVVLLLDSSGSMGWAFDGTPGVPEDQQRLAFAKKAATEFLDLLQMVNPDIVNVGIVRFGGTTGEVYGLEVITNANIGAAKGAIDALSAGGGTPLTAGVQTAENMFDSQICRAMVLLSDGYNNVPVRASEGHPTINNLTSSLDSNTRIFSVAFGSAVEVDIRLLKHLANVTQPAGLGTDKQFFDATTSGNAADWTPPTGLANVYNKILGDVFGLQPALDPFGRIGAGETPQSFPVRVTEHDQQVTFHLSWATPQSRLLSFRVFDSSGNEIPPPGSEFYPGVKIVHGSSYQIMTVEKEALRAPGRIGQDPWRLEVTSHSRRSDESEPFMYSVLIDSGLKLQAGLDRAGHVVGDEITLTAELREGRRPILDLADTDVIVTVTAPEDGRGNWLSTNAVSPRQLDRIPSRKGPETLVPVVRKGLYLTDIARIPFPGQKGPHTLRLFDDGSHGDAMADDGIYTNRFTDTRKEGTYSFYFQAVGQTQNGNFFRRESQVQTYLSVQPTPETIEIDAVRLTGDDDNRFDVLVTPKDPYGNFLGPGHIDLIRMDATNARFTGALRDLLDGSYSQTLRVDAGTATGDVDIRASVGETSKQIPLDEALPSKFLIAYYLGKTFPHGRFNRDYDGDLSLGIGLEFPWKPQLSAVAELQHSRFDADRAGLSDTDWTSLTGGIKYFVSPGTTRPYLGAGAGFYNPKSGSTEPGVYLGLGVVHAFTSRWSASLGAQHHRVSTSGGDTEFSLLRAGLNYRW